jgi:hypothetical protein
MRRTGAIESGEVVLLRPSFAKSPTRQSRYGDGAATEGFAGLVAALQRASLRRWLFKPMR